MPTVLSHPAVPLAIGLGLGTDIIPKHLIVAGILGSVLPDVDVLAFSFGIPYEDQFGHRGFTHSFVFAGFVALIGALLYRMVAMDFMKTFLFLLVSTSSHGILDAFTDGGLGIAFFWPFSVERYFAPFRPMKVSPIDAYAFLSRSGMQVLSSEFLWVWLPCGLLALGLAAYKPLSNRR